MIKITDTLYPEGGSRMEKWWTLQGFTDIYKQFRKGKLDPKLIKQLEDISKVHEFFHLKGYQFGNWVTNEDRYNYLSALAVCLYDLNKVLKFKGNNLGLDKHLAVAFGARGMRSALAHYEPWSDIINITRYKDVSAFIGNPSKAIRFVNTGGAGAFAHEYGHFLDYFFGARVETHNQFYALSNGRSTNPVKIPYNTGKYPMRSLMEAILEKAYWSSNKQNESNFVQRIKDSSTGSYREYFLRRNEIFARLFEQYIAYKLKELDIKNLFLTQTKYNALQYMKPTEFKAVLPLFDKLIMAMRKHF